MNDQEIRERIINRINEVNEKISNLEGLKYISISEAIGLLQEPFDSDAVAKKTYEKNFNNPSSKYFGMTIEDIKESWSAKGAESCHYGGLLDDYIGMILNEEKKPLELWKLDNNYDYDDRLISLTKSFDEFYDFTKKSGDTIFICRELTLWLKIPNTDYYIKGRFDALFYNKKLKKFIIVDWKSSGTIDKTKSPWTKNLYGPMMKYPALNWYTYTTQTFFYKTALIDTDYLPDEFTPDTVDVLIVQLPGHKCDNDRMFEVHKPAFEYDSSLMYKMFDFVVKKKILLSE